MPAFATDSTGTSGDDRGLSAALLASVGAHVLTGLAHGGVHALVPVPLARWQLGLVAVSVVAGPLVGCWLVVTGRARAGGLLVAASLLVAFGFELLAHFVVPTPDHVGAVHRRHASFAATAALSVVTDGVGVVAGLAYWRRTG